MNYRFDENIKAIDTEYGQYLFRSRLEARHAVYFDYLNVNWEYEKEGYELGNNDRYLPDFYFPDYRMFAEVKPVPFNFIEHSKCKRLAVLTQNIVIELVGLPNLNYKNIIIPNKHYVCSKCGKIESYDFNGKREYCNCKAKHNIVKGLNETEGFLLFNSNKDSYKPIYYGMIQDHYTENVIIKDAVKKAKSARFEFQK